MTDFETIRGGIALGPNWYDNDREIVELDGLTYNVSDADDELRRWEIVKQFAEKQAELSKWDCAGERAYNAYTSGNPFDTLWGKLPSASRQRWIQAAKAVLDEG